MKIKQTDKMTDREKAIEILVSEFREKLLKTIEKTENEVIVGEDYEYSFRRYLDATANYFGTPIEEMTRNKSRITEYRRGRQIAWFIAKNGDTTLPTSLRSLGIMTDEKSPFNHATVLHGTRTITDLVQTDPETRHDVSAIVKNLGFELVKGEKAFSIKRKIAA
tara:strand:+ start:626 stop:1117 length:492 start_codon:yes stop_codon:yes gene_type:complete